MSRAIAIPPATKQMNITQKSLKKEIYSALIDSQQEIEILKKELQLLRETKTQELITAREYLRDFQNPAEIHNKEIKFLREDLIQLINWIRAQFEKIQRVELPNFIK